MIEDMKNKENTELARRKFLAGIAGAASLAIAPGVTLFSFSSSAEKTKGVTLKVRWGMLIDTQKCSVDCNECVSACFKENGIGSSGHPETDPQWIRKLEVRNPKTNHKISLPMMCQHCAHPPCVDVCPTGASFKRADGIVLVDKHTCIGCRYCMVACPYQARSFVHEELTDQKTDVPRGKGTVESCTLCVHRIDKGGTPACVEACSETGGKAMVFGDLNDPNSEISIRLEKYASQQVRADLGLDLGVRYQGI
ncbi:MAG: 4Fe-4S dicluster domain-containing protein [Pseudomonadota bacterium]|nr:4Fe-4S dicluster domain-containing protein [Pseudomonadota bacterium]